MMAIVLFAVDDSNLSCGFYHQIISIIQNTQKNQQQQPHDMLSHRYVHTKRTEVRRI